jgi:hypothetical protein
LSPINEGGLAASTWQVAVNDFPIVNVPPIPILHYVEPAVFTW